MIKSEMFIYKMFFGTVKQYFFRGMINYKYAIYYVFDKVPREFYGKWSETNEIHWKRKITVE